MDRTIENRGWPEVIDLISIVFEPELVLLEIQARSIELYIDTDRINNIIIIINDSDAVASKVNPKWWGINSHKVKVIPRSSIGEYAFLDGWRSQQLYKLAAANMSTSDWAMCLDAKTWFVNTLEWDCLFDNIGRVNFKRSLLMEEFSPANNFVETFFDINSRSVIGPGGVPFMFHTRTVRDMIDYIEQKTEKHFFDFFAESLLHPINVTEFVLYSGYVECAKSYSKLYSDNQYYKITNLADWQMPEFDTILANMGHPQNLTASIQSRAYSHLSDQQFEKWINLLITAQLIPNSEKTKNLLNTLR